MKKLFMVVVIVSALFSTVAADEFFEAGSTLGGYGELHWNKEMDNDGQLTKNQIDFHRFIIYYGFNWTDRWSFKSEVELEHNFVRDGDGELELEQAYVNYHAGDWGFQGGVILPTVGLLNEYHEPPLFLSVERPDYNKYIIPTTWFGNGFVVYGKVADFNLRLALMEDLEGEDISSSGIRDARGKGNKTTGYSLVKNMSAVYTGINGLRIGGSITLNDAPVHNEPDTTISVQIFEINAKYDVNNIYAVLEFGQNSFEGNNTISPLEKSSGYYLDVGYNIGSVLNCNRLVPWFRVSKVSKDVDNISKIDDYLTFGLTYWPIDKVAFKIDYGTKTNKADPDNPVTQFNIGIGYNF